MEKAVAVGAAYFEEDDAYFEQAERVLRQQIAAIDPLQLQTRRACGVRWQRSLDTG